MLIGCQDARFVREIRIHARQFQFVAPPRKANEAELRFARSRHYVRARQIDIPKRGKCRLNARGQRVERDLTVGV